MRNGHRTGNGRRAPRRILVAGAAGAASLNYIRSLRMAAEPFYLIGVDCNRYQLLSAETDERHLVPGASRPDYIPVLRDLIQETGAEMLFAQADVEVAVISERRDELPARLFMPDADVISLCQDKYRSYLRWRDAGLAVPETRLLETEADLAAMLDTYGEVWLRALEGAAGRGALLTSDLGHARMWIERYDGWGQFTAARYLSPRSVTWQSIWKDGELVLAQGRERLQWEFGNRAPSGVTGITGAGFTVRDEQVDEIAELTVRAVDPRPHGIYSVDLTRDADGTPNPTEINIGRFFTTSLFFATAGLNMPYIFTRLAFGEDAPLPERRLNPLEPGLLWLRGMDREPVLTTLAEAEAAQRELEERARRVRGPVSAA